MNCLMAKDTAHLIHGGHPDVGGNGLSRGSISWNVITKKDLFMTTYSMNHLSGDGW